MNNIKDWFPLYAGDWMTSVNLRLCSPFSRGIMIDLMAYSWQTGTPGIIKETNEDLCMFFHCSEEKFSSAITELEQRKCIKRTNKGIEIERLKDIAAEQHKKHIKKVEAGRKGGLEKSRKTQFKENDPSSLLPLDKRREEIEQYWNDKCDGSGLTKIKKWTAERKRLLKARLKDEWFVDNWQFIFDAVHENKWCRETKQSIEHVLRPKNALRYYEKLDVKEKNESNQDKENDDRQMVINIIKRRGYPPPDYSDEYIAECMAIIEAENEC